MLLRELLKRPGYRSRTSAECVAALDADAVIATDSTAYTWSGLATVLVEERGVDPLVLVQFRAAMPSIQGTELLQDFLISGGADFSKPSLRGQINAIIPQLGESGQTVLRAMLEVGITHGKEWQREKLASLPTEQEIDAERATIASEDLSTLVAESYNTLALAIEAGSVLSPEAAIARFTELVGA